MFGSIGMPELIIILVIALIIFGPRKLPELGKSLGRSLNEFKKASTDLQNTLEQEIKIEEQKEHRREGQGRRDDRERRHRRYDDDQNTAPPRETVSRARPPRRTETRRPLTTRGASSVSQVRTATTTSRTCPRSRAGSRHSVTTRSRPAKAG